MRVSDPTPLIVNPVIPVITIENARDAVPARACALRRRLARCRDHVAHTGGARCHPRDSYARVPDVIVGAGTLLFSPLDVTQAVEAGAHFLVAPGTPRKPCAGARRSARVTRDAGLRPVSRSHGAGRVGIFGAEVLPARTIRRRALAPVGIEPLPHIRFCPTGGINGGNAADYLALRNVIAVGGSWIAPAQAIGGGRFQP